MNEYEFFVVLEYKYNILSHYKLASTEGVLIPRKTKPG
jgi:hypothetical protein